MVLQSSRVARQALRTDPNPLPAGEVVELPRLHDDANLAPVFAEMRDDHSRGLLTDWAFVAGTRQRLAACWVALMHRRWCVSAVYILKYLQFRYPTKWLCGLLTDRETSAAAAPTPKKDAPRRRPESTDTDSSSSASNAPVDDGCEIARELEALGRAAHIHDVQLSFEGAGGIDPCVFDLRYLSFSAKMRRRLEAAGTTTLRSVFARWRLLHVPSYVNRCMELWALGRLGFVLMFTIPTPRDVLFMQARGTRVVTALLEPDELRCTRSGRDALDFVLHDFQHFDKLIEPAFWHEQVGTFWALATVDVQRFYWNHCSFGARAIDDATVPTAAEHREEEAEEHEAEQEAAALALEPEREAQVDDLHSPWRGGRYDHVFWHGLDYIISDMNACCIHLLGDLKAKHIMGEAHYRLRLAGQERPRSTTTNAADELRHVPFGDRTKGDPTIAELAAPIVADRRFQAMFGRLMRRILLVARRRISEVVLPRLHGDAEAQQHAEQLLAAAVERCMAAASRFCTSDFSRHDALAIRAFFVLLGQAVVAFLDAHESAAPSVSSLASSSC